MVAGALCPATALAGGRDYGRSDSSRHDSYRHDSYQRDYRGSSRSHYSSSSHGWATAGALIAGIAIGSIARDSCTPRVTYYTPRCYQPTYVSQPVQTVYVTQPVETRVVYTAPQVVTVPQTTVIEQQVAQNPIIRDLGNGRRLYQAPVKGAPSYLQAWSTVRNEWVSLEEQPSMW